MSTCRYDWWSYAKSIVRKYPELVERYKRLKDPSRGHSVPSVSSGPHRHVNRPTEDAALRELPKCQMRELNAVARALKETSLQRNGDQKIALIDLVYWRRTHNLAGAAMKLYISEVTAKRWNGEFLRRIGKHMGFIDG